MTKLLFGTLITLLVFGSFIGCGDEGQEPIVTSPIITDTAPSAPELFKSTIDQDGVHRVDFHIRGYTEINKTEARFESFHFSNGKFRKREWHCTFKTISELNKIDKDVNQHIEIRGVLIKAPFVYTNGQSFIRIYLEDCEVMNEPTKHNVDENEL